MNYANEQYQFQPPSFAHLGTLVKLPFEIRLSIWEYLFHKITITPDVLNILRCNRYLYDEISTHLYRGMKHEIRLYSPRNSIMWLYSRVLSKRLPPRWRGLHDFQAIQRYLHNFPRRRIDGHKLFVNVITLCEEPPDKIEILEEKLNQLVDILQAVPVTPVVWVSVFDDPAQHIRPIGDSRLDHKHVLVPFMRLSNWHYRISPGVPAIARDERGLSDQYLHFTGGNGFWEDWHHFNTLFEEMSLI